MTELIREDCWSCNGCGKVRKNTSNHEDGTYTFGKIECSECGGGGKLDYLPCSDCGAVVPAYLLDEHNCDD